MTGNDSPWRQLNLTCDDWHAAEHTAVTVLGPLIAETQTAGIIRSWWFVRKGNTWRIRLQSPDGGLPGHLTGCLLGTKGVHVVTETIYEPETTRFGGTEGMDVAHHLFAADSRCLLSHLAAGGPSFRRELPVILASRMLRAAGQDWYEQGDCWQQLAANRRDVRDPAPEPEPKTTAAVWALLSALGDTPDSPLRAQPDWVSGFEDAGRQIAALASRGVLARGQRAVFAQHMIFLFNRHGVPAADQLTLASAACQVIFGPPSQRPEDTTRTTGSQPGAAARVTPVTTTASPDDQVRASSLRDSLADYIKGYGAFQTAEVETAFRTVSRHQFLPGVPLEECYSRASVVTRRAPDGTALSSASSPTLVAAMLEQLRAEPGQVVLEIGTATGFNAALLACLTAPGGTVVTIEFDGGLAAGAAESLSRAGCPDVRVITGDGALGASQAAPYQRIIVTAEATDVTPAWWDQLAPDGRIVLPVRLHGSGLTRSIGFRRTDSRTMTSESALVCGFVPMRGSGEQAAQYIQLAGDDALLKVDAADLPDTAALAPVLGSPADARWTGIRVRYDEPAEHLDLWLATAVADGTDASFSRLSVTRNARDRGLADPAMRWAGAGLYQGDTLAYLTARPIGKDTNELGIAIHGPDGAKLAETTLSLLAEWDRERPAQPTITATRAPAMPGSDGVHVTRPCTTFTITW